MALASPRTSALDPALLPDIHALCTSLGDIRGLAEEINGEIAAIAIMAMTYIDQMDKTQEHKVLKNALHAIWDKAGTAQDCIYTEVEDSLKRMRTLKEGVRHV